MKVTRETEVEIPRTYDKLRIVGMAKSTLPLEELSDEEIDALAVEWGAKMKKRAKVLRSQPKASDGPGAKA